ncbi:GNAT family N-acetyltransferase [Brevundimonas sp.]|uniref:GNAT family N-acetyltransferase n=1 Tax=Brevundimonas sp. TaxID=1871086 RepID=UPI00286C57E9|nr:GNAT family N-acetyltransferase [Brevundimonas sp.]
MTVLTTARLTLTPASPDDYDDLVALWRDEAFTRFIAPGGRNAEEVWMRLLRDVGQWSVRGYGNWTVRLADTGDHVGSVGALDFKRVLDPPFDAPEMGWGIAPRFHGQGLAQEALDAALRWCDAVLKAPKTVCMIDPTNTPSLVLAARTGFREYARTTYKTAPVILFERPGATST